MDSAGNAVATGTFEGTIDFGGGPVTSAGSYDAFVMKLDTVGNAVFRRTAGGMAAQAGTDIDVDSTGDIVLVGTYQNSIDWGLGPHTTSASTSTFVTKFDPAGNTKWSKAFGGGANVVPDGALVDPAGHVLLTGSFSGAANFGDGAVTSNGLTDLFVAKLDATGQLIWKKIAGDGEIQTGGSVAVDDGGHVLLGARIWGAVDVGTGSVASHGKDDALVAKLKP
jgi:ribosomal protein S11